MSGVLAVKGILPAWKHVHSDFANYYVSAKLVSSGVSFEKVYDNGWFQEKITGYGIETPGKFSPFPPLTAFVMVPLTSFEPLTAQRIFTIINLLFIAVGLVILQKLIHWSILDCSLLILSCGLSLINNVAFGQVYWIMTIFSLLALYWAEKKYTFGSGILLGFFAALKYFSVVFIAGFFLISFEKLRPKWNSSIRVAVFAMTTIFLLIIFQVLFFGKNVIFEFTQNVFLPHLDGELLGQGLFSFRFQSWGNFFRNLFVFDPEFNPSPLINWEKGRLIFKGIVTLAVITTAIIVLRKTTAIHKKMKVAIVLTSFSLAALVLLPASATYHFILLLIPIALMIRENLVERNTLLVILGINFLIGVIPYELAFQLGRQWGIVFAYPRLWLVTMLYGVALIGIYNQIDSLSPASKKM